MIDSRRRELVKRLLVDVSRTTTWTGGAPVRERLARAIAAQRLEVDLSGLELSAWVTDDVELAIWVRVRNGWSSATERALAAALESERSVIAGLLLADWDGLVAACSAASADQRPRSSTAKSGSLLGSTRRK
jgi:hypothetical protein